jgi:chromosome segregation protein
MLLRRLVLRGFKSFADRTVLEFGPGVSVIVGPNGSGKSNIVDAISWVLGEQGPRALRGGQMADVIFAGGQGRPALGMTEVTLVIDNSAGLIRVDASEIEVSRTIYRSGESEYSIGGKPCRLMDIQELLSDTGIGRGLHTVIGQGHLEDVLTARPEDRRRFVEEAAGIAKHRRRKERAQRKLASLDQDLLRLQDVMTELKRQLRPLKQQAEAARKYEKLNEESRNLAWRLAAARLRDLYAERDTGRPAWEEGRARRMEAEARLAELDSEIAGLAERLAAAEEMLSQAETTEVERARVRVTAEESLREAVREEGPAAIRREHVEAFIDHLLTTPDARGKKRSAETCARFGAAHRCGQANRPRGRRARLCAVIRNIAVQSSITAQRGATWALQDSEVRCCIDRIPARIGDDWIPILTPDLIGCLSVEVWKECHRPAAKLAVPRIVGR